MTDQTPDPTVDETQDKLREKILEGCERLGPDDTFTFSCHPGVPCFNKCCGDVNIFLSPYDVLRLKERLSMSSTEFLDKHALLPVQKEMKTPIVVLRMNEDEDKTCPFLGEQGCTVYEDRPWPCRMYPLGLATSKDTPDGWRGERFYFLLKEEVCQGFCESKTQTVAEYMDEQGVDVYDEWGEAWKELTLHEFFETGGELSPEKLHMLFTAAYDLDKFRQFVFGSTLLERFDVDEDFVEEMKYSDDAMLRFAFLWLRYSLFGETTMRARDEAVAAVMGKKAKQAEEAAQKAQKETP